MIVHFIMQNRLKLHLESNRGHGIVLPQLGIGLDTRFAKQEISIISHAHSDHVPQKAQNPVWATSATIDLILARGFKGEFRKLDFFKPYKTSNSTITLFPAGHILGSAMIFIESDFGNLLYTGDFRFPASPVTEGCFFPEKPIDIFIAEATFGLPIYKWKPYEELKTQIISFAQQNLEKDITPIFMAYNLGKGQELMHILASASIPMQIHEAGFPLSKIFEIYGFSLGVFEVLNPKTSKNKALIMPANFVSQPNIKSIKKKKIAYVSGWAALENKTKTMQIDERIVLSDHVDFYELLKIVGQLKPTKTYITHSPNPEMVCYFLKKNGFDAEPLEVIGAEN